MYLGKCRLLFWLCEMGMAVKLSVVTIVLRALFRFLGALKNPSAVSLILCVLVFNGQHCSVEEVAFSFCRSVLRIVICVQHEMALLT